MTKRSPVAAIIAVDEQFRGDRPFAAFATALHKRVPGAVLDWGAGELSIRCPRCGRTAYVMASAAAAGDAIWCSGGCEDEDVAAALLPVALGDRMPAGDLSMSPPPVQGVARHASAGSVRDRYPLLDLHDLVKPDRPARRWLWEGVIPEGDHVSLIAPAGTGKSLVVQALAVACAAGAVDFIGQPLGLGPDRLVLYIDMENTEDDLAERLKDLGVTIDTVDGIAARLLLLHMPQLRGLDTEQGASQLMAVLDEYGISAGDMVILDSTQRVTEGDENSNDTVRRLYNFTSIELKRRGLTVIRTDNTGHEGSRARGASAKRDDVAASWLLEANLVDPDLFTLKPLKRRSKGASSDLRFRRTTDAITGLLVFVPESAAPAASSAAGLAADVQVLSQLVPSPKSKEDVRTRLNWGSTRAMSALRAWRTQSAGAPS